MSESAQPSHAVEQARTMLGKFGAPYDEASSVVGDALDAMVARLDDLERRLAEIEAARAARPPEA